MIEADRPQRAVHQALHGVVRVHQRRRALLPVDRPMTRLGVGAVDRRDRRAARARGGRAAKSKAGSTAAFAAQPHRFVQISYKPTDSIIVPRISSERREYIPIGYLGPDTVISNAAFAVYDAEPWVFALLTSRMHMAWTRAVGGQMKTDYRYSNTIVYNNFPVPPLERCGEGAADRGGAAGAGRARVPLRADARGAVRPRPDAGRPARGARRGRRAGRLDLLQARLRDRRAAIVGPVRYV